MNNNYWPSKLADEIEQKHPTGLITFESGHSPSGNYHIGLLREIMTNFAVAETLKKRGRDVQVIDYVDDFDAIRKIPKNLTQEMEQYLGMPLYLAPAPDKSLTYAQYFLADLDRALNTLGVSFKRIFTHEKYLAGEFTKYIEIALENKTQIKEILERVSKRKLPEDWAPVQLLSDSNSMWEWKFVDWDPEKQEVIYQDQKGTQGRLSYATGRVKLDWRIDWPARWHMLDITVEPFGRDHATKGGSYDTGSEIVKLFGGSAPYSIPYEFITPIGGNKKMSKSAGNVMTPLDALEIMPPEVLRYYILRNQPKKELSFDAGIGLYRIIDEFSAVDQAVRNKTDHEFSDAYELAVSGIENPTISSIRFSHLVQVTQSALGDPEIIFEILARSGYQKEVEEEKEVIVRELEFVKSWLQKYAPEEVKFEVINVKSQFDFSDAQKKFLSEVAEKFEQTGSDPLKIHTLLHETAKSIGLPPNDAFQAMYQSILAKDRGPRAGFFLAILDAKKVVERFRLNSQ